MEPEQIEKREFLVSLRGYDREEVDAFLREVAEEFRRLKSVAVGDTDGAPVPEVPAAPPGDVADAYRRIGEETSKILVAAEQVAAEMKAKAQREAAEVVAEARADADEVARMSQQRRVEAEEDMRSLQEARAMLATQLEDVSRRIGETIARLQATAPQELPTASKPKLATQPIAATLEAESRRAKKKEPEPAIPVPPEAPMAPKASLEAERQPELAPTATPELAQVLDEIERERSEARREVAEALAAEEASDDGMPEASVAEPEVEADVTQEHPAQAASGAAPALTSDPLGRRAQRLKDGPALAARRMKRILQEDQNDLLDRIRTRRGKGSADDNIASLDEQVSRFSAGLTEVLSNAFREGRLSGGASDAGDPGPTVQSLITKQVVRPLRAEISKTVTAGLEAQDTPSSIAERASDIFRVWKGIRTELLGEGLVYSAYHQGLMDAWRTKGVTGKRWVFSSDERDCPRGVCETNAAAGPVSVDAAFPSGHLAPPAHGGCTCTVDDEG